MQVLDEFEAMVDRLVETDADALADADSLQRLHRGLARIEAVAARSVAAFDASGVWSEEGARSAANWLAVRCNVPAGAAHRRVRTGAAIADLPVAAAAWFDGEIGEAHVAVIAKVRRPETAEALARDEEAMVEAAKEGRFGAFCREIKYWFMQADPDGADDEAQGQRTKRELWHSKHTGGLHSGDYTLDAIGGEIFANELSRIEHELWEAHRAAVAAGRVPDEAYPIWQRRADALVEMARRSATAPADGQRPAPLFSVFIGWESFRGMISRLASGTAIAPGALAAWLDEAWVERVVFEGGSRVIDLGAQRRLFTGATRRAVQLRDQQECFHEFCDLPPLAAQIDHIQPWSADGPTIQDNGRVACGPHNRERHRRKT